MSGETPAVRPSRAHLLGIVYTSRIRHEMADFVNWRRAAVRSIHAEPLYRPEDGHYQYGFGWEVFRYKAAMTSTFRPKSSVGVPRVGRAR